ncbi:MAG TPA: helix-turn-helix transcriptional regulator [Thermoanaerobaculia bacterium]|jgi:transcriptional regulator with XRE-family HTH domain|nr:helix-turn-helix transcriptional regulator [Thermoanaerobaculia bacterium]
MPELKGAARDADAICFGLILKRHRVQRGWTLQQLGRASGLTPTFLGVMERGGNSPSLQTLLRLAEVFQIDATEIVREIVQNREQFRRRV